jgi:hypothetical protein
MKHKCPFLSPWSQTLQVGVLLIASESVMNMQKLDYTNRLIEGQNTKHWLKEGPLAS